MSADKPLPPHIQQISDRHGSELFEFVLNTLTANEMLQALGKQVNLRNPSIRRSVLTLAAAVNQLAARRIQAAGWTSAQMLECQGDIERAAALGEGTGEEESAIILSGNQTSH